MNSCNIAHISIRLNFHYLHSSPKRVKAKTESGELFEALRTLRKRLADQEALPAYIVLSDKVLHLLSTSRPTTIEDFGNISGIGEYQKKKYGKEFVELIRKYS